MLGVINVVRRIANTSKGVTYRENVDLPGRWLSAVLSVVVDQPKRLLLNGSIGTAAGVLRSSERLKSKFADRDSLHTG